jgi:hypothetical protein
MVSTARLSAVRAAQYPLVQYHNVESKTTRNRRIRFAPLTVLPTQTEYDILPPPKTSTKKNQSGPAHRAKKNMKLSVNKKTKQNEKNHLCTELSFAPIRFGAQKH